MRVKLSLRAQQRARIITTWWRKHRPGGEEVFEQELVHMIDRLALMSPRGPVGTVDGTHRGKPTWRILLPRTKQYLFYEIDEAKETVVVIMIWGARRGHRPGR